ncbi:MAG: fibronectin type III domain-containing protein [Acetobacter sp.]|nr:fibronectin type III domain-containing protein [Bacteroides sp.]MCM1340924.1 fibronectin type III domain-containing protein [Acetobacter sp.]MCM1432520.1 fibronectin type III domain-containing protein [Clostridiales bacterium]
MKRFLSVLLSLVLIISSFLVVDISVFAVQQSFGIDISEWDENFDLKSSKADGNDFVMIRLGYYNHLDKYFEKNVEKAYNEKMNFGVYLYSYAYDMEEAQVEADFVIDTLANLDSKYLEYMTLPVAYDLEEQKMSEKCTKKQITNQMVLFCDAVKDAGYTPMVYANQNWFKNYIDINTAFSKGYKLWYAYYPSSAPKFTSQAEIGDTGIAADMWQYSTTNETLDKNVMYPSMKCDGHTYDDSTVNPTCTSKGYVLHKCSKCGYFYKTDFKNTIAHKYKDYTTNATVSKNGSIITKCSVCGTKKSSKTIYYPKTVTLSTTSYTYNGKVRKPTVTVKDSKGNKISASNYTVAYASGRKNVGKYNVTIKFKGSYSGTVTKTFTIKPKSTSISKVTAGKKKFTVKWKKLTSQTTGYQIQYSTSSKFTAKTTKTVTVSKNKTTSKSVSKLKAKKKYYVRVRTYKTVKVNGKNTKIYSSWSKAKTVTTKK